MLAVNFFTLGLKTIPYREKEFNETLGFFLADARRESGLTPLEIATELGITEEQLSKIEHFGAGMTAYQARRFADITGVSIAPMFENFGRRVAMHMLDFQYVTPLMAKVAEQLALLQMNDKN